MRWSSPRPHGPSAFRPPGAARRRPGRVVAGLLSLTLLLATARAARAQDSGLAAKHQQATQDKFNDLNGDGTTDEYERELTGQNFRAQHGVNEDGQLNPRMVALIKETQRQIRAEQAAAKKKEKEAKAAGKKGAAGTAKGKDEANAKDQGAAAQAKPAPSKNAQLLAKPIIDYGNH